MWLVWHFGYLHFGDPKLKFMIGTWVLFYSSHRLLFYFILFFGAISKMTLQFNIIMD